MKTLNHTLLFLSGLAAMLATSAQSDAPATNSAQPPIRTAKATPEQAAPASAPTAVLAPAAPAPDQPTPAAPATETATGTSARSQNKELRLNFRNAPLESVLNYLSDAAGFIIDLQTDVKGKVTVWSNQPVTKEEAVDLLNAQLDKNGYTAIRNGRTLTIWPKEDAKKHDLPVKNGSNPQDIPKNDEMVTQIIPVHYINAVQVSRDLAPLLPDKATMTANEGGNAIILTDTQISIHRMAEIIKALDTAISSVSSVKVFPLRYADSKALAGVIKDLFAPQDTGASARGGNANQGGGNRFFNQFRGGGPSGGGGPGGGNQGGAASSASGGRAPTPRVIAVAEERSNSVVVSAPDDQMPVIEDLVKQVDTNVEDITELRVFKLRYADAQETADLLSNLFSDSTSGGNNNNQGRGLIQFGGRFGGPFGGAFGARGATAGADQSSRLQKQTHVVAVPDLRTGSVIVSAARDLMLQIGKMIDELDADPAKKQQVYVYDVQNTDPQQVLTVLQSLFPAPNNGALSSRMGNQQNGVGMQLNNRAQQLQNSGYNRTGNSGFGGSGLGSGMGGGLGGGLR